MRPSRSIVEAILALLALSGAVAAQENVIRVNVNLVRILATVKNPAGELVSSLDRNSFEVTDNGVLQQIAVFERETGRPLSVAVLVDTSGSTAIELKYEVESVSRFLKALFSEGNPQDTAALYTFNYQVTQQNYFTHNHGSLERSLKSLRGEAGTALYDAVYLAARDLEDRDGRKVMVIVTDGGDTTSSKNFHDAVRAAQMADAVMYPVLVVPITNDAGRNIGGENALTTMAAWTGGRVFTPNIKSLDAAFDQIIRELRTQYLIGFYPKNVPLTKNPFHQLRVRVPGANLQVVARNGYYGEVEPASTPDARISVVPQGKPKEEEK